MPEIIAVGPFMIRGDLLALIVALAAGFAAMAVKVRRTDRTLMPLTDVVLTGAIIVFVCWKLGPLLNEPELIWEAPLKLITLPGTGDGVLFGVILAVVYLLNRLRRVSLPYRAVFDGLALFALAGGAVYALLTRQYGYETTMPWGIRDLVGGTAYHPVHLYAAIVYVIGLVWVWTRSSFGSGQSLRIALLFGGLGGLAVSLAAPQTPLFLMLSGWQLVCIGMVPAALYVGRIVSAQQTYTNAGKGLSDMPNTSDGDSIAQKEQAKANKSRQDQKGTDKKLDGPNRPST